MMLSRKIQGEINTRNRKIESLKKQIVKLQKENDIIVGKIKATEYEINHPKTYKRLIELMVLNNEPFEDWKIRIKEVLFKHLQSQGHEKESLLESMESEEGFFSMKKLYSDFSCKPDGCRLYLKYLFMADDERIKNTQAYNN